MDRQVNVDVAGGVRPPCVCNGRGPDRDTISDVTSPMCGRVLSPKRMPDRTRPCDDLIAFADGELDSERAAAFRLHLCDCEACQRALIEAVQLSARLSELTPPSKM
jgi:hypothetical protein